MEKIKVIFTGGTIGSLGSGNDINVNSKSKYLLLEKYGDLGAKYKHNLENIECESPINILSENAVEHDILDMVKHIKNAEHLGYKGVVLTHGSDTLAYSCAYLSFLLSDISIPVVLVASNYILTDKRANGVLNFAAAIDLINSSNVKPFVYVSYKNTNETFVSVHLGTRVKEPMPFSDCFYSLAGYRFATWEDGNIIFENTNIEKTKSLFDFKGDFNKNILYVHPFNGLNYDSFKGGNYDYVLHNLYHSGTANTRNIDKYTKNNNILNFIKYCNEKNIPFYLCNIEKKDVNYNSTNQIFKQNVKPLYNILPNVAIAKLNIAYNLIEDFKIEEFLNTNISGEILN